MKYYPWMIGFLLLAAAAVFAADPEYTEDVYYHLRASDQPQWTHEDWMWDVGNKVFTLYENEDTAFDMSGWTPVYQWSSTMVSWEDREDVTAMFSVTGTVAGSDVTFDFTSTSFNTNLYGVYACIRLVNGSGGSTIFAEGSQTVHENPAVDGDSSVFQATTNIYIPGFGWTGQFPLSNLPNGVSTNLLGLLDTPSSYVGQSGKTLVVNTNESGVTFSDAGAGDMTKAVYDTDSDNIVDNAEAIGGEAAANVPLLDAPTNTFTGDMEIGESQGGYVLTINGDLRVQDARNNATWDFQGSNGPVYRVTSQSLDQGGKFTIGLGQSPFTKFLELSTDGTWDFKDTTISNVSDIVADSVQLTGGTGTQGTVSWNPTDQTLDLVCDGSTLQIGQEFHKNVHNGSGAVISNGMVVAGFAIDAGTDNVSVRPMIADGTDLPQRYYGVATEDIAAGAVGKASVCGKVRGIDTSAFSVGDELYVSATTAGALTATKPTAPNHALFVGLCLVDSATVGVIDVAPSVIDPNKIGDMQSTNNLSDLTDAATARSNLGLVIGTDVLAPDGDGSGITNIAVSGLAPSVSNAVIACGVDGTWAVVTNATVLYESTFNGTNSWRGYHSAVGDWVHIRVE